MEITIIAAIAPGGVIGRTSKPCEGLAHERDTSIYGGGACTCLLCGEGGDSRVGVPRGRVPANDMPWHYPEDLARFKALTMGHAVIMGRRTWESLPPKHRPLAGRANVVVSRSVIDATCHLGAWWTNTLDGALRLVRELGRTEAPFIVGGARLFAEALPLATTLELTLISKSYDGDIVFPGWVSSGVNVYGDSLATFNANGWAMTTATQGSNPDLTFTEWVRR